MAAQLISDDANVINGLHLRVVELIRERYTTWTNRLKKLSTRSFWTASTKLKWLWFAQQFVDIKIQISKILWSNSSWNSILRRLRNQITATCILADLSHLGPAANDDELNALHQVKESLHQTYANISPAGSLRASSTDTD